MIDETKLFLTEADLEEEKEFTTEDFLATDEETDMFYEQVLCEWKVDPEKKKKIIQDACNSLQKYINASKNEILKKGLTIYKPALITKVNATLIQKVLGKTYDETKTKRLLVGHYDFNLKELSKYYNPNEEKASEDSPYKTLKNCMREVNGDFDNITVYVGVAREIRLLRNLLVFIPIPGLKRVIDLVATETYGHKAGTIWVKVEKKGMKRTRHEGAEFATSVLDELFNE